MRTSNICNKIFFTVFLFLICIFLSKAQVYNKQVKLEYDVLHVNNNDTVKMVLYLDCKGVPWKIPIKKDLHKTQIENAYTIEWKYIEPESNKRKREVTGVTMTAERIFLHPPRTGRFAIIEFCPFPIIEFPLKIGKEWNWKLENIPEIYYQSIKEYKKSKITTVRNNYRTNNITYWNFEQKKEIVNCHRISARGITSYGDSRLTLYYSDKYGFVFLSFETLNKDKFIFTLKNISDTEQESSWNKIY